jgi:DNA-binding transcriptional LysR family regulator
MKLNNIRDILAVAEAGSIRGASRQLGITQPAMTRSIRDTENELGVSLFMRHGHGTTLTEMGHIFVQRATAIQSELRHITEEIGQAKGQYIGEVAVAMSSAANLALMPVLLREFEAKYPQALLKLTESLFQPIEADIYSGQIDFFVGPIYENLTKTSLQIERLFDNKRIVIARKGHPLVDAKTLEDLRGARWVRPTFTNSRDEADFTAMFERAGLPLPDIAVHMRSAMMTLMAVANSDLLTIVPIQWLEYAAGGGQIQAIELAEILQAAPVCIVRRSDLPLTPLAERLCDITRKAGLNYGIKLGM